jgi:hypothetical protein
MNRTAGENPQADKRRGEEDQEDKKIKRGF